MVVQSFSIDEISFKDWLSERCGIGDLCDVDLRDIVEYGAESIFSGILNRDEITELFVKYQYDIMQKAIDMTRLDECENIFDFLARETSGETIKTTYQLVEKLVFWMIDQVANELLWLYEEMDEDDYIE